MLRRCETQEEAEGEQGAEEEQEVQVEEEQEAGEVRAMRGRRLARAALQWRTRGEEAGVRRWRAGTREEREAAREREARAGGGR